MSLLKRHFQDGSKRGQALKIRRSRTGTGSENIGEDTWHNLRENTALSKTPCHTCVDKGTDYLCVRAGPGAWARSLALWRTGTDPEKRSSIYGSFALWEKAHPLGAGVSPTPYVPHGIRPGDGRDRSPGA